MRLPTGLVMMLVACSSDPATIDTKLPDAGVCQGVSCGLPGQDPCGCGATCVDFQSFGSTQCAMSCNVNADCTTGACIQDTQGNSVCAPAEFGGVGGIYPETVCKAAAQCGFFTDQTACNAFFQGADDRSGCLGALSQSELAQWITAVDSCGTSSCTTVQTCFDSLPFCTFTTH